MTDIVQIKLAPHGRSCAAARGTPLQDVLFDYGVEFPCGGRGRCRGCRVKVLKGDLPVTLEMEKAFDPMEIAAGWRLACLCRADQDLTLELAQWETTVLADDSVFEFAPKDGLGAAVDLGTTTIVAQLIDLRSGRVLAVASALNAQARHGADIMSRVNIAILEGGLKQLAELIRGQVGKLIKTLIDTSGHDSSELNDVVIAGNTVMHNLFCGIDPKPLAHYPFEPNEVGLRLFEPAALGWDLGANPVVRFLPCIGGFVGSDILSGVLATRLHESRTLAVLIDLGTNGEVVIGNNQRLLCASTAAGPAFEGARISMGMRADTGAVSEVTVNNGQLACHVLGHAPPRGICGSGLVDAVAAALELGWIQPSGRLTTNDGAIVVCAPVKLTQADIRELQLAKGAIAAGIRILLEKWGAELGDVHKVYLAGAFGNYVNRDSARRIGMIGFRPEQILPAGNTSLLGAKLALFGNPGEDGSYEQIRRKILHFSLSADPRFQDVFLEELRFPG